MKVLDDLLRAVLVGAIVTFVALAIHASQMTDVGKWGWTAVAATAGLFVWGMGDEDA